MADGKKMANSKTTNTPGISIEKWSQNFDLGTPSAIFGTLQGPYFKDLLETVNWGYFWSTLLGLDLWDPCEGHLWC